MTLPAVRLALEAIAAIIPDPRVQRWTAIALSELQADEDLRASARRRMRTRRSRTDDSALSALDLDPSQESREEIAPPPESGVHLVARSVAEDVGDSGASAAGDPALEPRRGPDDRGTLTSGEATEPVPRMVLARAHAGHPEVQHARHRRLTALLPRGGLEERAGRSSSRSELPLQFGDEHAAIAAQAREQHNAPPLRNALACWGKFVVHRADSGGKRTRSAWHRWAGSERERMEQLELPQARAPDVAHRDTKPVNLRDHDDVWCPVHGRNRCRGVDCRPLARCGPQEQPEPKGESHEQIEAYSVAVQAG